MGITGIPESFELMEQMNIEYEKKNFGYSEGGKLVADATLNLMLGWFFPKFSWNMLRPFAVALMDKHLRETLKYPAPNFFVKFLVNTGMGFRKIIRRALPLRQKPVLRSKRKIKSYPKGYTIPDLGVK